MKKLFLFAAAAMFIGTTAQAQDVKKQQGGEQNLELQFAPFGGSPISMDGGIKYRTFTSATTALRASVYLGFSSSTDIMVAGPDDDELKSTSSSFDIEIAPGFESHFAGTDALSPYVGAELRVGFNTSSDKEEYLNFENDIEDATTKDGSISFGAGAFAGVDWYFAHRIYLGAELGFGVMFTSYSDTKVEYSDGDIDEPDPVPNGSAFNIGPHALGKLRLGFLF